MARLDSAGAEVDMRRGSMSYSPSAVTGASLAVLSLTLRPHTAPCCMKCPTSQTTKQRASQACGTGWKTQP